jgi:phenylacetate-CoA ligase
MLDLETLYRRSPVLVQNIMATSYGLRERWLRYGGRYRQFCRDLDESQWWPLERLQSFQSQRLQALVTFCGEQVPYYQDLFSSNGLTAQDIRTPADLAQLPMLDKEVVRETPERFMPRRLAEKMVPQTTGGTTGKPLRYFVTPTAVQYNYATYEVRFRRWAGVRFGERMASINGKAIVPAEATGGPFWRYNLAFNQLYLSAYHLSEDNLHQYVRRLESFRPASIVGYVSTVHTIARFILKHNLVGSVRPKAVLVSSETLFDWLRADIESAFQCKVFDGYGMGELAAFITECEAGSLHVSPEYGVVETVEVDKNLEMVCTGLSNYAMPLLRYRTGDIVEPGDQERCACGRQLPTVKAIMGRIDDRIITPEGAVVGPAPLSLAFQGVPNLKDAQICQESPREVAVSIVTTEDFGKADEQLLLAELRRRLGHSIRISLSRVPEIARTSAGKQRLIVSKIKRDTETSAAIVGA